MRVLRGLALLCTLVAGLAVASPALAAFPGRNGNLVVQPVSGGGLLLVGPQGHGLKRICTSVQLCGTPAAPRFSPDGRDIAFVDTHTKAAAIVAADGTCMWCLLDSPLTATRAATPAFMANAQALTFSVAGKLLRGPLTGGSTQTLKTGTYNDAVWSAGGALAFVRTGWIWVIPRNRAARRLTQGTTPDFSPSGKSILYARGGWLWVIPTAGGKPQRLVKGSFPVFSPDGRSLAFVRSSRVYVAGVKGKHARAISGVRARAIDWQPVPRASRKPCAVPSGSSLVAQTPEAVVTRNPATPLTPWYGCTLAIGKRVALASLTEAVASDSPALNQALVAGRFAAVSITTRDTSGNCTDAVDETDLSTGKTTQLYSQNCATASRGVDSLVLDSSGFAGWHAREQVAMPQPLVGVSCPGQSLCVAVDGHGNAAATTNPAGGAGTWSLSKVAAAFTGIYCASTTLCLGLDAGAIITTTNPTAGASAWASPVVIDAHPLTGVSCASGGALCVAVDGVGDALTSTNPTGGAAAWQSAAVTGGDSLTGVACPLVTRCIAVGQNGDVLTSSTPTNSAAWSLSIAETGVATLTGVTCPSPTECVATDSSGNVLVTTDPAATSPAWTVTHVAPSALYQPACATTCVARDAAGDIFTSTNPAAAAPVWSGATLVNAPDALTSLGGCQATGSGGSAPAPCVLTDSTGNVLVSTDPAGGPAAWVAAAVDTPPCGACVSEQVWAHDDLATRVLDDVLPGPGTVLAGVAMAGDSTTLTWTHSGSAQAYTLR